MVDLAGDVMSGAADDLASGHSFGLSSVGRSRRFGVVELAASGYPPQGGEVTNHVAVLGAIPLLMYILSSFTQET